MSSFASVTAPDFPGECLLVCYNPLVAAERRRQRPALLDATERAVRELAAAYAAGKLARDELNRRLGGLRRRKMVKHFDWTFDAGTQAFRSEHKAAATATVARLDDLYVIRASLTRKEMDDAAVIAA